MRTRRHLRLVLSATVVAVTLSGCAPGTGAPDTAEANCPLEERKLFVLMAQAVPSATLLPCVAAFPAGWSYGGSDVHDGEATFWLSSDRAGLRAVEVELTASCRISGALDVTNATNEAGVRVFVEEYTLRPFSANRYFLFSGGCVTYRYRFEEGGDPTLALEADEALTFGLRSVLVEKIETHLGLTLCGAGAPPCPDGG